MTKLEDFFEKDPRSLDWHCRKCSAIIYDLGQHYKWHRSVDSIATVEVINNVHSRD
jgi:hypothetical protein